MTDDEESKLNHPNTTATLPEGWKYHPPLQRHAYGAAMRVAPEASDTGLEQFERPCLKCGVTRITIIGAVNPRAWRLAGGGGLRWREPLCEPAAANVEGEAA